MKNPTTFSEYLSEKNYKEKTIRNMEESVERFFSWKEKHRIQPQNATYDNLLEFIRFCREQGNKPVTINKKLVNLRTWFEFLISVGKIRTNPALDLKVKSQPRTLKTGLLNEEQLQKLYNAYLVKDQRNQTLFSLIIFQGLTTREIFNLKSEDVDLKKAEIRIRENSVSSGRTLKLESVQILLLFCQLQLKTDKLFPQPRTLAALFQPIKKWLKRNHFPTLSVIRSSIIANWLKRYNLRQVQYMAGHKKVQATESYKTQSLDKLKTEIETFHPLKTVLS